MAQLEGEIARLQALCTNREALDAESRKLAGVTTRFSACVKELKTVEAELGSAREHQRHLQQQFISGQAAFMAARLEDGSPCPVCGSGDHPHPATGGAAVPTEQELEQAAHQISSLEQRFQKVSGEHQELLAGKSGLEAGIDQRRETLGEAAGLEPDELHGQLTDLKGRQAEAAIGMTRLATCRQEREQVTTRLGELKSLLAKADHDHAAAVAQLESSRALVEQAQRDAGDADEKSVSGRIEEIAGFIARTAAALEKAGKELTALDGQLQNAGGERSQREQQLTQMATQLVELRKNFGIRLAMEGFAGEQEYREAKLPRQEIDRLQQEVTAFRERLAAATSRRDRSELACTGQERPDLEAVKIAKELLDTAVGNLQKEAGILSGQHSGLSDALRTIGEKGARITVLEQEFSVTARLADLVGGQNPHRMTLQRYVLAALFEEVAIAASQRLARMSRGRYHLVRSDTPRDGKATGGLDLDVTDDYIGEKRPAFTLSGGESFLASLSLALGLSDVVMAQRGGRYLDCIFIDEGFGSLDGETLDFALNTLIELHRTGRVIGIISHVAELKERIPSRIDVIASKDGSRIVQETI